MRLLRLKNDGGLSLVEFVGKDIPRYAVLSHTWGADDEEVTFKDLVDGIGKSKAGYSKIRFCGKQVADDGLQFFWVDTCCIDKSSSSELSEAINSMFRWYHDAAKCYVYLSDVSTNGPAVSDLSPQQAWKRCFERSRWFTRGWTLQELLAPKSVEFFSVEGKRLGDRNSLIQEIHSITGINVQALKGSPLSQFSIDERMSWAARRQTKREEDAAYSLLGIFDIHMPLIYGEGRTKALIRLRKEIKEILKDNLTTLPSTISSKYDGSPSRPSSNIPFLRDRDYVDRRSLLDQIHEKLSVPASRVALVGLGGVGKSQVAIEHSYRIRDKSQDSWIFWVHGSNAARFEQSLREIAGQVKIPNWMNPKDNIFELVHNWLRDERKGKWVIILDNVDDADFLLKPRSKEAQDGGLSGRSAQPLFKYLPPSENGSILITTRSRDIALKLVEEGNIIAVEPMDKDEALTLLERKLGKQSDKTDIAELAAALESMPLAIVQASAYIRERAPRCSVRQYIEIFRKGDKAKTSLLNYDGGHLRRDWEAKNSIILTWQISFNHIFQTRRSAADLLSLMSFFDRQGIPEALIRDQRKPDDGYGSSGTNIASSEEGNEDNRSESEVSVDNGFDDDILTLRNYSFISVTTEGTTFEMHGLVQLATRKWLEGQGQLEPWKQQYITNLCKEFPTGQYENWAKCRSLLPHVKSALTQQPQDKESLKEWALLLYNAAWYAWQQGSASDAIKMSVRSMKVRKKLLGKEQEATLSSITMVAQAYSLGGQLGDAEELFTQVMETRKRVLGEEHPATLTSINDLASTLWNQGRWKEAEKLDVQVMETFKRVLGEEHPSTLSSMANLASTYRNQGRWKEAEELEVQVVKTFKRVFGDEHSDTLNSLGNLALTFWNQGRWKEAEELEVQVMETRKKVLGEEHPDTLKSKVNLASTYRNQGRWKEAEKLDLQVKDTRKRVLGGEHPSTLSSMSNLASTYRNQGRWKEAEELGLQVMKTFKRVFGEEHPTTLNSLGNLALTYWNQGRWKEAEELEVQVMETFKKVLGEEHPDMLSSMANLASTYRNQGRLKDAEDLFVKVMETFKRMLGEEHPSTLSSMGNLALTYRNQGRWKEAEALEAKAVETFKKVLGEEHPSTLSSMANLASTYRNQGRWKEAEELELQVMKTFKRVFGGEHTDTLNSTGNLALTYWNQGRLKEAEELEVQVMETRMKVLGEDHPDTLSSMNNLAFTFHAQGLKKEAISLLKKCSHIQEHILGPQHPHTISSLETLKEWLLENTGIGV